MDSFYQGKIAGLEISISTTKHGFFAKTVSKNNFNGSVKKNGTAIIINTPLSEGSPIEFYFNSAEDLRRNLIDIGHSDEDANSLILALDIK